MPQSVSASVENNFTKGLITEATGLSFPENAAFDTQNCVYEIIGDVVRREGFDIETNGVTDTTVNRTNLAMSTYKWNNVGGDGSTQIIVRQVGATLYFFLATGATASSPLSTQKFTATVGLGSFQASGNGNTVAASECTYADGNGYLFVYHKDCDPFYCYFIPGTLSTAQITPNRINVQIRDFFGIYPEPGGPAITARPTTLNASHNYNLRNQGWTANTLWGTTGTHPPNNISGGSGFGGLIFNATNAVVNTGNTTFTVDQNITGILVGQSVNVNYSGSFQYENGGNFYNGGYNIGPLPATVVAYTASTGSITVNIISGGTFDFSGSVTTPPSGFTAINSEVISVVVNSNINTISTWNSALGNYPSNADIWWRFINPVANPPAFAPATMVTNVTLPNAQAPNGSFVYNVFNQNRTLLTGISGLTSITTTTRPTNGCWFSGRVFYTGVNASQTAANELGFYTWTENIYFSQIIDNASQFGYCFQQNDPTDKNFFDLLPDDGGVITIQGSGQIYKLFPVQNGLVVFAANGVWFITGSQGIGFAANDYTVTKISGIQAISSTSFINVRGWPVFWNEEGIYAVAPGQNGQLQVENLCVGTILTYYSNIPLQSKKYARGDYHPLDYIMQWSFRSTNETGITDRYQFDSILNFNTVNKAFYPYKFTLGTNGPFIHDVKYVAGPGGSTSPSPVFKYLFSNGAASSAAFSWAEEHDNVNWTDWHSVGSVNYVSYFVTGYKIRGQAQRRWQPSYVYLFLRNSTHNSYKIQGQYDFGITGTSGKWSTQQVVNDFQSTTNFGSIYHRHKIRGHGLVFQMKVSSVDGKPFDVIGWSVFETQNQGV